MTSRTALFVLALHVAVHAAVDSETFDCTAPYYSVVPRAVVRDGVCDCCNGHDEAADDESRAETTTTLCPDTCTAELAEQRAELTAVLAATERGMRATLRMIPDTTRATQYRSATTAAREAAIAAYEAAALAERKFHTAKRPREQTAAAAARRELESNALRERALRNAQTAMELDALVTADYGAHSRLLPLAVDSCATSPPISEKASKGGSTTSSPKLYAWEVCGFQSVRQIEVDPSGWRARDAVDKGGEATAAAVMADGTVSLQANATDQLEVGTPTWHGAFRGYISHADVDAALYEGQILGDDPSHVARLLGKSTRPSPAAPARGLPREADIGGVAAVYSAAGIGAPKCWAEDMSAERRAFVFYVCPGLTPAQVRLSAQLRGAPAMPQRFRRAAAWNAVAGSIAGRSASSMGPAAEVVFPPSHGGGGAWNRSAHAHAPRIIGVDEDGLCTVLIYVSTPLACSRAVAAAAKAALESLHT